jgi:hypothetical protein
MAQPFGFGHKTYRLPFFCHSRPHQDHRPKGGNPGGEKICKILYGLPEQSDGNPFVN